MNKDLNKLLEKEEELFLEIEECSGTQILIKLELEYTKKLEALKNENARLRAVLYSFKEEVLKIECLRDSNVKNDLSNK